MNETDKKRLEDIRYRLGQLFVKLGSLEYQRQNIVKDSGIIYQEISDLDSEATVLQAKLKEEEKKENE